MVSPGADDSVCDVFLSFRGDTRNSFTDHLNESFKARTRLHVLKEDFERGEELWPEIERSIKGSKASIVVLSKDFATSTWCLDELCLMLEERRKRKHIVIPVFYHVDPSDVRKHDNTFNLRVKDSSKWTDLNVARWKEALTEVANLIGDDLPEYDQYPKSEAALVKLIVDFTEQKIDSKRIHHQPNLIGIDIRSKEINPWLKQSNLEFLAIYGMGGSGKTTLAEYIYESNKKSFEYRSFIKNIGSKSKSLNGLLELQKSFLKDISQGKDILISTVFEGTSKISEALEVKNLFLVLDDITEKNQLEALLGTGNINALSKIIITSRGKDACDWLYSEGFSFQKHEMKLLTPKESSDLFIHQVSEPVNLKEGFQGFAAHAVEYCGGNPMALNYLGRSLQPSDKPLQYWSSQLNLLENDLDSRVETVLNISYDSLPDKTTQRLFLHIACFFVGEDKDYVEKILEPDYSAVCGIGTLSNRCLLSVSSNKKLMMHRLLQEMGKSIVLKESSIPERRSRVWHNRDSYKILGNSKGSETIEALALDMKMLDEDDNYAIKKKDLTTDSLNKMNQLKLLQLNYVKLTGSYDTFSEDLRWLCWLGFHLTNMPPELHMGNLVALNLSYSNLVVFKPPERLQVLQILNLRDSHNLSEIGNFIKIPNLETLILWNCDSLLFISPCIGDLEKLTLLKMTGCKSLFKMQQTSALAGSDSSMSIKKFRDQPSFPLPYSLQRLYLDHCHLKSNADDLMTFKCQIFLQFLNLGNNLFKTLPSYNHLNDLRVLNLIYCLELKELANLPCKLEELYVDYCVSLETITFQSHQFPLQKFGYTGCLNLYDIEGFVKLVPIAKLDENDLGHMKWLRAFENHEVGLFGDDALIEGKSKKLQILYEFDIMSTSLICIRDQNLTLRYTSKSPHLMFSVPSCPNNKRLKGLDVTFQYEVLPYKKDLVWFAKITTTNNVDLIYNPKVFGKPELGEIGIWLGYWPIGNKLQVADAVDVYILALEGLRVHNCGASLVYTDDEYESPENSMCGVKNLENLSEYQLNTGAYYLCRDDFLELMEAGRLDSNWLGILAGDTVDYAEVQGWRKTGRPKQLNPSSTELRTVRCIIDGPESEEIYKITEISKSTHRYKAVQFTLSMFEDEKKCGSRSTLIETEEQDETYNKQSEGMSKEFVSDEITESASRPHKETLESVVSHKVIGQTTKKLVLGVKFRSQRLTPVMDALSELQGIDLIAVNTEDGTLTITGDDFDRMKVLFVLGKFHVEAQILSEHETEAGPVYESEKEKRTGTYSRNIPDCSVL